MKTIHFHKLLGDNYYEHWKDLGSTQWEEKKNLLWTIQKYEQAM